MINDKPQSIWSQVDWLTIGLYIALMLFGWLSICGASYSFGDNNLLSLDTRSGMQILWIGTSICLGFVILMMDSRFFDTFSFIIYGVLLLLLFATIFNPHDIKGSHSWLVIGPLRLQPAEFGKFATALALAKLMSTYGYNIQRWKDFAAGFAPWCSCPCSASWVSVRRALHSSISHSSSCSTARECLAASSSRA